jgi:hypothetical protein
MHPIDLARLQIGAYVATLSPCTSEDSADRAEVEKQVRELEVKVALQRALTMAYSTYRPFILTSSHSDIGNSARIQQSKSALSKLETARHLQANKLNAELVDARTEIETLKTKMGQAAVSHSLQATKLKKKLGDACTKLEKSTSAMSKLEKKTGEAETAHRLQATAWENERMDLQAYIDFLTSSIRILVEQLEEVDLIFDALDVKDD